jgi:DNA-binding beta-propeller fold protein YncE
LAGDTPMNQQYERETASPGPTSVLDHHLNLSITTGRWIAVVIALLAAVLLRVPGLDRWALSATEGETAFTAWNLLLGQDVPSELLGRPFTVEWTTLFMFLGHSTDSVVRMSSVVAGIGVIVAVLFLGRWLGTIPATSAAILVALSPTMIANSRRIDGGMLVTMLMVALIVLALASKEARTPAIPAMLGVVSAALILSGPLGVGALLLGFIPILLFRVPLATPRTEALVAGIAGFVTTYVVLGSVFFTRPGSLLSSTIEIFRQFFGEHLANAGDRFHVPAFNLLVNEPLLLLLAAVGLLASNHRELTRVAGIWFLISLVVISLLGDTGIAGHALVVLPLTLLAGLGVEHLVARLPWQLLRQGPGSLYVAALILLFLAFLSLIGLLSPSTGLVGWDWLVRMVLVILVVVLPLAVFVSLLAPRISGQHIVLILATSVLLVSGLTMRSAVLAASERPGAPMDPLAHGAIASSLPAVINRIERVSIDLTRTQRSPQDPTGGHGLAIAIDREIEQPLLWYFRDFPNVKVFDPLNGPPDNNAQVAFIAGHHHVESTVPGMAGETYLYAFDSPGLYSNPDWVNLLGGLVSISDWRHFWSFMVERTDPPDEARRDFHLMVSPAIGERLFGPSGPFALQDMAGAGSEGGQFNSPRGIAISVDGTTYVVDSGNQRIQVFDPDGNFVSAFAEPGEAPGQLGSFGTGQSGAGGIASADDRVFVADTWNHRIQVFSRDGEFLYAWGTFFDAQDNPELAQASPGEFYGPRGIAILEDRVYVTDTGNERVQVFDLDGRFIEMWGETGTGAGQLLEPVGIAVHGDTVYVADSHNARVARYSLSGQLLDPWPVTVWSGLRFYEPYLAVTGTGRLIVTTSATNDIVMFEPDGTTGPALLDDEILRPFGIAIHPDGDRALVTDGTRNAVLSLELGQ